MIEDFLGEIEKPQLALKLLLIFLTQYIEDNNTIDIDREGIQNEENLLAISYVIDLINNDLNFIKDKYKKQMILEKYPNNYKKLYG